MTNSSADDAQIREPIDSHRERCYGCFRPVSQCFCAFIPAIQNATEILILQHARERFHAFNTARLVHRALAKSAVHVGYTPDFANTPLKLSPRAGLLYPESTARLLDDLPPDERPDQIVVLDGTWHHAHTMIRDIPWLAELPRFRICPDSPSRYRIRREPNLAALSTVEATVDVLRALEPELSGLDELLRAFNVMIDRHIAVEAAGSPRVRKRKTRPPRIAKNIPRCLSDAAAPLIVAYGESAPADRNKPSEKRPVYWVAERLETGERFCELICPPTELPTAVLDHMQLTNEQFARDGISLTDFRSRWRNFVRAGDVVAVYNKGTRALLDQSEAAFCPCILLKSINFVHPAQQGTLDQVLASLGLQPDFPTTADRAHQRLENALTLVRYIRQKSAEAAQTALD